MFCDEECDAVHLRHSLGLELNSEPGPMLCNSRQLVNVLLQEKAKEILVKAVPLGTRLEAILQRTDELRQLGTLPEVVIPVTLSKSAQRLHQKLTKLPMSINGAHPLQDGLKMEREQMEGARALWHLENHRWTSAISTYNAEQDQRRQAMLAAQQQRDQQAAQQRAAAAAAAAVPANSSDQAIATGQQYQRSGANPAVSQVFVPGACCTVHCFNCRGTVKLVLQ